MFENILGNEEKKKILSNLINTGNVSHSYIFSGKEGVGKFLFAKEFAKAILCTGENKPCNACDSCIKFDGNNNPDIKIIDDDEKSIKNEKIKELVKDVLEKPIQSDKKVYIINDSEKMTKEAQNSLLKTLEEPPEYAVIILIAENEYLLLNTIKSRCTKFKFDRLTNVEITKILKEKYNYEEVIQNLLDVADGSVAKALSINGKEEKFENIKNLILNLENLNEIQLLNKKDIIFKDKDDIFEVLDYMNVIAFKKSKENIQYANCIEIIENTKDRLKKNSNYDMTIDNLLLKLWGEING